MKHVSNQEKATEIAAERKRLYFDSDGLIINSEVECYAAAEEMAKWKDEQLIEQLTAFAQHLNKRGAFRDDLCMDFEHEAQSFIEMQKNKEL